MLLGIDNRFTLDFSNTELNYQINFSTENDYYITTINSNSVIANSYGRLLDDMKKLSTKNQLLLEKGAAYQLNLSLVELNYLFQVWKKTQIN